MPDPVKGLTFITEDSTNLFAFVQDLTKGASFSRKSVSVLVLAAVERETTPGLSQYPKLLPQQ